MKKDRIKTATAEICRIIIGSTFTFSGFVKAIDPVGFGYKINEYIAAFGMHSFHSGDIIAVALTTIEFALGISILLGTYRKHSTLLSLLMMSAMTPLTLYLAIANPVSDCGCFGDAIILSNWGTFTKNVILLSAAIFLYIYSRRIHPIYPKETRWFIPVFALTYGTIFALWNYNNLPLIDFRPYKTGIHIPSQMTIPEGQSPDEYSTTFTYERNGTKQTFTLDNYPAGDTTWTFVDAETKLIRKGYTPPIPSFPITNEEGLDISPTILEYPGDRFLLISPRLEDASDDHINEITTLHEYALNHNIPFHGITGSSKEAIEEWKELTGAEYPFLTADETQLKTIIRSNPGFLWLYNGRIMMKRHHNHLPDEESIAGLIATHTEDSRGKSWVIFILLTFSLPLFAVWTYSVICFTWKSKRSKSPTANNNKI